MRHQYVQNKKSPARAYHIYRIYFDYQAKFPLTQLPAKFHKPALNAAWTGTKWDALTDMYGRA